jgi:hypothetical protein
MFIPDNEDIRERIELDLSHLSKNPVLECDICRQPIYEGDDYLRIDEWDKCVCSQCADGIGVWDTAE